MSRNGEHAHEQPEQPETAVEEVLREVRDGRPRDAESDDEPRRGEAGDATSPNTAAQQDAEGE